MKDIEKETFCIAYHYQQELAACAKSDLDLSVGLVQRFCNKYGLTREERFVLRKIWDIVFIEDGVFLRKFNPFDIYTVKKILDEIDEALFLFEEREEFEDRKKEFLEALQTLHDKGIIILGVKTPEEAEKLKDKKGPLLGVPAISFGFNKYDFDDKVREYLGMLQNRKIRFKINPGVELKKIITEEPYTTLYKNVISCLYNDLQELKNPEQYFPFIVSQFVSDKRDTIYINILPKENSEVLQQAFSELDIAKYKDIELGEFNLLNVHQVSVHVNSADIRRKQALYEVDEKGVIKDKRGNILDYVDLGGGIYSNMYFKHGRELAKLSTFIEPMHKIAKGKDLATPVLRAIKKKEKQDGKDGLSVGILIKIIKERKIKDKDKIREFIENNADKVNKIREELYKKIDEFLDSTIDIYSFPSMDMKEMAEHFIPQHKNQYGCRSGLENVDYETKKNSIEIGDPVNVNVYGLLAETEHPFFVIYPTSIDNKYGTVNYIFAEFEEKEEIKESAKIRFADFIVAVQKLKLVEKPKLSIETIARDMYIEYASKLEETAREKINERLK